MFAKFDPRQIILDALRDLDMTIINFCLLQPEQYISRWNLEKALRGERNLDKYEAEKLTKLAAECRELQDSFPVPLNFRDTNAIKSLLQSWREKNEQAEIKKRQEERRRATPQEIEAALDARGQSSEHGASRGYPYGFEDGILASAVYGLGRVVETDRLG